MRRLGYLATVLLACVLTACATGSAFTSKFRPGVVIFNPDKDPYWDDPRWQFRLMDTIEAVLVVPADPSDTSPLVYQATVRFRLQDGSIQNPEIVTGTGHPDLDKLMLQQLASVQPPTPTGPHAGEPHDFTLDVDMLTPYEALQHSIYDAIDSQRLYPKDAILAGTTGIAAIDFDYVDGNATGIALTASSKDKLLDKTSLGTVARSKMPSAPSAYAGKTIHVEVLFCYTLWESPNDTKNNCPVGRNVIVVSGTRIRRVESIEYH